MLLMDESDVIHRREATEAVRKSERRYRTLVAASSDVVYHMSPDWTEMRHRIGRGFIADTRPPRWSPTSRGRDGDTIGRAGGVIRRCASSQCDPAMTPVTPDQVTYPARFPPAP